MAVDQVSRVPPTHGPRPTAAASPLPQKTNADLATAIANSTKSAVTLATVRALRTFGPALGLGLNDPVAMRQCTPACPPPPAVVTAKQTSPSRRYVKIARVPYPSPAKSPRTAPSVSSHPAPPSVSKKRKATPPPPSPTPPVQAATTSAHRRTLGTSPARSRFKAIGAPPAVRPGPAVVAPDFVKASDLYAAAEAPDDGRNIFDSDPDEDDDIFNQVDLDNLK